MKIKLTVEGMSCSHCEKAVKQAVAELYPQAITEVSLAEKTVIVTGENLDLPALKNAIDEQGYDIISAQPF